MFCDDVFVGVVVVAIVVLDVVVVVVGQYSTDIIIVFCRRERNCLLV